MYFFFKGEGGRLIPIANLLFLPKEDVKKTNSGYDCHLTKTGILYTKRGRFIFMKQMTAFRF